MITTQLMMAPLDRAFLMRMLVHLADLSDRIDQLEAELRTRTNR